MEPDLFLGQPDIDCEGSTNLLVATLPMWGTVKVTQSGVEHLVEMAGEMELTLTPDFRTGPPGADTKTAVEVDPSATTITARRWTATVTSERDAACGGGPDHRKRVPDPVRGQVPPGGVVRKDRAAVDRRELPRRRRAQGERSVRARAQRGAADRADVRRRRTTTSSATRTICRTSRAATMSPASSTRTRSTSCSTSCTRKLVKGVEDEGASLDSFSVRPRDGYFYVSGAVSKSSGTVNFSFRVVPSMFHTRPGAYFQYSTSHGACTAAPGPRSGSTSRASRRTWTERGG